MKATGFTRPAAAFFAGVALAAMIAAFGIRPSPRAADRQSRAATAAADFQSVDAQHGAASAVCAGCADDALWPRLHAGGAWDARHRVAADA